MAKVHAKTEPTRPLPPQLAAMAVLMRALGDPHMKLRFVHIAGTNGKGSTAAFLARILRSAGLKTGLFTSPHITRYQERIRVNGDEIGNEALQAHLLSVDKVARAADVHPNYFQRATAAAFLHFHMCACDIAVLETGLGGRLDPTNIIPAPEAVILTRIGMDHMGMLGNTLDEIATEKAGIIKPGADVFTIDQPPEAARVIAAAAQGHGAHMRVVQPLALTPVDGGYAYAGAPDSRPLGIGGAYQAENAALARAAALALNRRGFHIPEAAVHEGLISARWPARFEVLHSRPAVVLDGAHNPDGMRALIKSLTSLWPKKKYIFLMGFMQDKAYTECVALAAGHARGMIAVSPGGNRALESTALAEVMHAHCENTVDAGDIQHGLKAAKSMLLQGGIHDDMQDSVQDCVQDCVLCVCGSLYLAAAAREAVNRVFPPA